MLPTLPRFTKHQRNWPIFCQYEGQESSNTNYSCVVEDYNSFSMFETNGLQWWKSYSFYRAAQCLNTVNRFPWLLINYKLHWKNGNSNVSKHSFSFMHSSVDHSTLIPIIFLHSRVRWGNSINIRSCKRKYMQMNAYILKNYNTNPQLDTDPGMETPVKLFSYSTSNYL